METDISVFLAMLYLWETMFLELYKKVTFAYASI